MFYLLVALAGGAFIYSIFQGMRRGDVSMEERKKSPTLIEGLSEEANHLATVAEKAERQSKNYLDRTTFESGYCGWFRSFEASVTTVLEMSIEAAAWQTELDTNPELRKSFDRIEASMAGDEDKRKVDAQLEKPDWVIAGRPATPEANSDVEASSMRKQVFDQSASRHKAFIRETNEKLQNQSDLIKYFNEKMKSAGLDAIRHKYFSDSYS